MDVRGDVGIPIAVLEIIGLLMIASLSRKCTSESDPAGRLQATWNFGTGF